MHGSVVEEYDLPTAPVVADPDAKLLFKMDGVLHRALDKLWDRIQIAMANVRGPDPDVPLPPPLTLADVERMIQNRDRNRDNGIHITNQGRSGAPKWLNKFILGVGVSLIASAVVTTATTIVTVASIRTRIEDYILSNDRRLERDERQIDETRIRQDRGGP